MPWSASVVYLPDTDDARAVLGSDPRLARRVYAIDLAKVDFPPTFERPGLLAIRAPGSRRQLADLVDGFDWKDLDGGLATQLAFARAGLAGPSARIAPPDAPLRWLEELAARVAAPLVWYQAEALASDPDGEIAWVLDWGAEGVEGVIRAPTVYTRKDRRFVRLISGGENTVPRDPLGAGLLHLGIRLDGPWFTPHRPDFPWESCRV